MTDIRTSLARSGVPKLLIISGHGGNYVLSHVAQEASIDGPSVAIFPSGSDWKHARVMSGMEQVDGHADMHAGELETSILLHALPNVVRASYRDADHDDGGHPHFLTTGLRAYTDTGVAGYPSSATPERGRRPWPLSWTGHRGT